ncbi:MAG: hypothetical protein LIO85_05790 [Rikenellaceae bacterium]|nr:hypothetical protein [Rikenellaceae bacterium]
MRLFMSPYTDPVINLATEAYLRAAGDCDYLMVYINDPCVVVGRNQSAEAEADTGFCRERGIRIIRRISGGGAVYHDRGNVNYSFIRSGDSSLSDGKRDLHTVVETLRRMGLGAAAGSRGEFLSADRGEFLSADRGELLVGDRSDMQVGDRVEQPGGERGAIQGGPREEQLGEEVSESQVRDRDKQLGGDRVEQPGGERDKQLGGERGELRVGSRSEILLGDRKISGTASFCRGRRYIFHGTLLFDSDLVTLEKALNGDKAERGRKIASVPSPVTNIRDHLPGYADAAQFAREFTLVAAEVTGGQVVTMPDGGPYLAEYYPEVIV